MPDRSEFRLVVLDPGHFHAALVQKEMCAGLSPDLRVYAPLGPDLIDYLTRIARFNGRSENPTRWRLDIRTGEDPLGDMVRERRRATGNADILILSGRNRDKLARMQAAVDAGMHVLADKPAIVRHADLPALAAVLDAAEARGLVVRDLMAGRHDVIGRLMAALREDAGIFGEAEPGTRAEPGVEIVSVHHILKEVAGVPNPRPPWYFDITEQGEGLADIGTHLADRVQRTLFPGEALDWHRDIGLDAASRWPTRLSLAQFRQVTGAAAWPDFLAPWLQGDAFEYFCNMRLDYRVRGVHVRLECRWDWQAPAGDDTHNATYRGSRAHLELRQGPAEDYRQELYVVPQADIAAALERRIAALQAAHPGIALDRQAGAWHVVVPAGLRLGHDRHFAAFTRAFLAQVADPRSRPAREKPNMLAKYHVSTGAVALSHGQPAARRNQGGNGR